MTANQILVFSLIELGVGVFAALLAALVWQYRENRAGRPLLVMAVGTSLYAITTGVVTYITDPFWWQLGNNIRYPIGAAIAVSSFFVVAEFTEQQRLQNPKIRALLVGFVSLNFLIAVTGPVHNLTITSQQMVEGVVVGTAGPLFWVHTIISLGIVFAAMGVCFTTLSQTSGIYRRQSQAVLVAFCIGVIGFMWQSTAPVHPALDIAAVGMLGWCGVMLWAIFVTDFLDIVPIGRYRVVETIDDPVFILDDEGRVIDSNPATRQLVDAPDDWEGTALEVFFHHQPQLIERIEAETEGRVTITQDGRHREFIMAVSTIDTGSSSESPTACIVILRDVTAQMQRQRELERSRQRYRSLFENSPLVLWEQDFSAVMQRVEELATEVDDVETHLAANPDLHRELIDLVEIIDVNDNAVAAYDADSKQHLLENIDQLFTESSLAMTRRLLSQLLAGNHRFREEHVSQTLNGDLRYELYDVVVPEAHADDYSRILVATTDITERKEREQRLTEMTDRLQRKNEQLERLAKVISHDLQTPLSTAQKNCTILRRELDEPTPTLEKALENTEATHRRLQQFADHLPRLARESTDVTDPTTAQLSEIATDAWGVVETKALELEIDGDRQLECDPRRLQQVFENLFSNVVSHAVDQAPDTDAATTVRVRTIDDGFAISDDGPGVTETQDDNIFQYGMSTSEGSGAGLAIVRSIVEAHGWSISVGDAATGGARFIIKTADQTGG